MSLDLKSLVRTIPDYPKKGILFRDITTLIEHPEGFRESIERIAQRYRGQGFTHVAGIEARGFIFGAGVAIAMGVGFVPVRKRGKLPGETIGQNYALEYGVDTIEIHADVLSNVHKVLLVDDLIATGGTALAAVGLMRRTGAICDDAAFVIDLPDIGGAAKLEAEGVKVMSLIAFEGH
ncbi:adenine phosphoribosyltransferase [uncultured Devosia sp.]|uniref:adenine phosphoribosyltransferase n=1 Tax=uncultured Devosia sp. TaxID=211434 RepID=UPI00261FA523|nr:adenine phosphoribosyltransferase [uncultured Devosia sp.]